MKNKKGFTLIELLAVIVILAVVMLIAATAVIPLMTKSRKNALLDEGYALEKAAKLAYQDPLHGTGAGTKCYSLSDLYTWGFYEKGTNDSYIGSVQIVPNTNPTTNELTGTFTTNFWITNKTYGFKNATSSTNSKTTYEDAENYDPSDEIPYNKCGATS